MTENLMQISDSTQTIVERADSVGDTLCDSVVLCADSVFIGGERLVDVGDFPVLTLLDGQLLAPVVQILMLAVILMYMWVVYRRSDQVLELTKLMTVVDAHVDRRSTLHWRLFGLFSLGSVAVMVVCKYLLSELPVETYVVVGGTILCVTFVWLLQSLLLWIVGKVVLARPFFESIQSIRNYVVELAGMFMTPIVVAYAFGGDTTTSVLWVIILIITAIVVVLFTLKMLKLFVGAGFSIFYLFLYLCAVEFFPMSLAVAVTLRLL